MIKTDKDAMDITQYICSVGAEPKLHSNSELSIDDRVKLAKQNNENTRTNTILTLWKEQQDAERNLRRKYANYFIWILAVQLLIINAIFVLIGYKILHYEQWTANLFIVSVFGEIVGIVLIIVKYLFTSTNKDMIELIKEQK